MEFCVKLFRHTFFVRSSFNVLKSVEMHRHRYLILSRFKFEKYFANNIYFKLINPYNFLGRCRNYNSRYILQNVFIYSGILHFLGIKKDENEESELIMTMKRGILLTQKGEFEKAEQMFHVALRLAQQLQNNEAVTYIYDLMANLCFEVGQHEKAEKLFVDVMQRVMGDGASEDDNRIISMSLKLAHIYELKQDYRKAEQGFEFCKNALQNKINAGADDDDTLLLWGMTLDWQAKYFLEQKKLDKAFDNYKKAYEVCVKVNGKDHEQTAILLNDLGTVSFLRHDYDNATKYFRESVTIGKRLENMQDLGSVYVNLGFVYMEKKMYEEAKSACQSAMYHAKKLQNVELENEATICLDHLKQFAFNKL